MKRVFAILLSVLMLMSLFVGCGNEEATVPSTLEDDAQAAVGPRYTFPTIPDFLHEDTDEQTGTTGPEELPPVEVENYTLVTNTNKLQGNGMKYVMIYNPAIYDENLAFNSTLSTGDISRQVNVDMGRADGLTDLPESLTVAQGDLNSGIPYGEFDLEGGRAGSMSKTYKKGDTREFYTYSSFSLSDPRRLRNFSCRYAGAYCNIWVYGNSITDETAEQFGTEFDVNVYEQMVEAFGEPRYADMGGKVNLLYYPMMQNLGGCFCLLDLWSSMEVTQAQIEAYGVNTDHAIIHMNADLAALKENEVFMTSTMAHEFQHLICGTDFFYTVGAGTLCRTWLNEAMSGYVEDMIFPGSKAEGGHLDCLMVSNRVRHGQSLYNFGTTNTANEFDIGVYGSVYLYAEYVARLAGDDVFSNFHSYWRNSYSTTLCESEALANSVSEEIYETIDQSIQYPVTMRFTTEQEAWMSKLTLQFYLDLLDSEEFDPADFALIDPQTLLYDEINPANIEGGGRVIFALQDGTYQIPADADGGLIYVGLDENFKVVTPLVLK